MLSKQFRLRCKEEFEKVFRLGKPLFFGTLGCRYLRSETPALRVGFSFGKKHAPLAVTRNRLRRVLSAAIASKWGTAPSSGVWIVFYLGKRWPANGMTQPEADEIIRSLACRLKL